MSDKTSNLLDKFDGDVKSFVTAPEKKQRKLKSIYADQLICLLALLGVSWWQSGMRALII